MFAFFKFIFWAQFLLFKDWMQGLWSQKFHCLAIETQLIQALNVQFHNLSDPHCDVIDPKTQIVLSNHRSYSDFFMDSYLCGGAANLGRYMVLLALPVAGLYGIWTGRILFFNRGRTNRSALTQKILTHLKTYQKPLIVYPEGRRYLGLKPMALRHGILKICFEQNLSCQILIGAGKEFVLNEKAQTVHKDRSCSYAFSHMIWPQDFETYDDFYQHIIENWSLCWSRTQEPAGAL